MKTYDKLFDTIETAIQEFSHLVTGPGTDPTAYVYDAKDQNVRRLLAWVDAIPTNRNLPDAANPVIRCLSHLCHAAANLMLRDAIYYADLLPDRHPSVQRVRNLLDAGLVLDARRELDVPDDFAYNPKTEDMEYGYEPPAAYVAVVRQVCLDKADIHNLNMLAHVLRRLPDTVRAS